MSERVCCWACLLGVPAQPCPDTVPCLPSHRVGHRADDTRYLTCATVQGLSIDSDFPVFGNVTVFALWNRPTLRRESCGKEEDVTMRFEPSTAFNGMLPSTATSTALEYLLILGSSPAVTVPRASHNRSPNPSPNPNPNPNPYQRSARQPHAYNRTFYESPPPP